MAFGDGLARTGRTCGAVAGRQDPARRSDTATELRNRSTKRRAARQLDPQRVRERRALPAVLEAEQGRVRRNGIEHELLSVTPPPDHPAVYVFAKPTAAQARIEGTQLSPRGDLNDHTHVEGRARARCGRIGDPEHEGCSTDEDDRVCRRTKRGDPALEQLEAHAATVVGSRRSRSCSAARPRTRASPARIASSRASRSAVAVLRRAARRRRDAGARAQAREPIHPPRAGRAAADLTTRATPSRLRDQLDGRRVGFEEAWRRYRQLAG